MSTIRGRYNSTLPTLTDGQWSDLQLDSRGRPIISAEHTTTGIGHGVKTVTTAGTDEALAASTAVKWVIVQAQTDNTGVIAIGASGVDATVATGTGILLAAGEKFTIPCDNLADLYVDATVSGDGVRYIYGS